MDASARVTRAPLRQASPRLLGPLMTTAVRSSCCLFDWRPDDSGVHVRRAGLGFLLVLPELFAPIVLPFKKTVRG